MTKRNQTGFSIIEVVLVAVVVICLGVIGWLVWSKQTSPPTSSSSNSSASSNLPAVKITEWGLKVTTSHADKLSYTILDASGYVNPAVEAGDQYDAAAAFTIHDAAVDPDCSYPASWLYRLKAAPEDPTQAVKIGDRYYTFVRPNGMCNIEASTVTRDDLIEDLKLQNISAL